MVRFRQACLLILLVGLPLFGANYATKTVESQSQIGRGRFNVPSKGQTMEAAVPLTITWELDNPVDVASQDLSLSTNGGVTFTVAIASHLSPGQRQLTWSTLPSSATLSARLAVTLHETGGSVSQVVSDDFSISSGTRGSVLGDIPTSSIPDGSPAANATIPDGDVSRSGVSSAADITNSSTPKANEDSTAEPNFPGSGDCAVWNVPNVTLDYNMSSIYTKCGGAGFNGEPAVAQDPVDPKHFVLLHNTISPHRGIEPNEGYGYSPQTKVGPLLPASGGYSVLGDTTVEITTDGSVYAATLGISQGSPFPDAVLLFRSTDGGVNFGTGVALPKPAGVQFVDKPVMDVHKNNPNILAITVNPLDSQGHFSGIPAYVVICTSATTLTNFMVVQPLDDNGNAIKVYPSLHPIIDPISPGSGSYWLFIVYTNNDFSGGSRSFAGMTVFQYVVTGSSLGNGSRPINRLIRGLPASPPLWTLNPTYPSGSAVEKCLRIYDPRFSGNIGPGNNPKAAIDYCDANAHRMYLPNLASSNGVSSDLYVTVWQYSGTNHSITSIVAGEQEIYPNEQQKYVPCAVTDGHGRAWVTMYIVGNTDTQRAQMAAVAIHRTSAVPGPIAYRSMRLPTNLANAYNSQTGQGLFLGDYVYTQGTFYTFNGRSRVISPTFMDFWFDCGRWEYDIGVSGWY